MNIFILYNYLSSKASACLSERKRNLNEERERVIRLNTITTKYSPKIKQGKGTGRFKANGFIYSGVVVINKKKISLQTFVYWKF